MDYSPLLTDMYELTMLAGYLKKGMAEQQAVFDLFFRTNPFEGGYAIFAGLEPALTYLEQLKFKPEELKYLNGLNKFTPEFLEYLGEFRFKGTVIAPPEGTVVFANEPLITVEGNLAEAQFVETALLNIINFQTLVATKAARIKHAAAGAAVIEFGLRRAQGPDGGLSCSRAACVGGICSTSNVLAGMMYGLPLKGTHAHSWVLSFSDELAAFRAYAQIFPDNLILLVDTYDTLKSGIPNAITVAKELKKRGHQLLGVRLDSGDLAFLSREARKLLDNAGFPEVKILASNDLDEFVIDAIKNDGGRIDMYGVGTRLATCSGVGGGALGGVYKLVELNGSPKLKLTSDSSKTTLPGKKTVLRVSDTNGCIIQDIVCLEQDEPHHGDTVFDPVNPLRHTRLPDFMRFGSLRQVVMKNGCRIAPTDPLSVMTERGQKQLAALPQGCLRLINPHRYKVSVSGQLLELRNRMVSQLTGQEH